MASNVSVIIPLFNASVWIRETLASAVAQGLGDIEVIVVDDGSTDGGHEIVEREFSFVRLIRTANQGASAARNLGTSLARGSYIQYLDADDLLMPGKLGTQIDALEKSGADVAYGDWQKLIASEDGFEPGELVTRSIHGEPELELFGDFWCPPAAYLFRRSIVDKVGGWNERLPVIQDARFALDCALQGGKFVYTPGVMAMYRVHGPESLSRRSAVAFHRDVYRNASEIEKWWESHGGVTEMRRGALIKCLGYVARATFESDPSTFEAASDDLERLSPGYAPEHPARMKVASKIVGYRCAEHLASYFRRTKRVLS